MNFRKSKCKILKELLFATLLLNPLINSAQQWNSLGTGVNSIVYAMYVDTPANNLYVGGWFTNAGGVFTSKIARWDGSNWFDLDTGVTIRSYGYVRTIIMYNGDLIVGGQFDSAGG